MKFANKLVRLSVIFLLSNSCTKENSMNNSPAGSTSLPKTYTENVSSSIGGNSIATYNLSYDANNRLTSVAPVVLPGVKTVYTYHSNGTFSVDLYDDGTHLSIHEDFFLNSSSFVDSTIQYNDTQDTTTEKYFYNASGQLTSYNEYDYSSQGATLSNTTTYTYDNNGNEASETDNNGLTSFTYTNFVSPIYLAPPYMKSNKNLVLSVTNGSFTATHSYTFDNSNRLLTDKAVGNNGDVVIKTYTY